MGNHEIPLAKYEQMCYNVRIREVEQMVRNQPVDVISVCSANGDIKPLRLRMEDEEHRLLRVDIHEIISVKPIQFVGIEAQIFLCKSVVQGKEWLFELKYTIRTHTWCILRKVY